MKRFLVVSITLILITLSFSAGIDPKSAFANQKPRRQVAITIDDLPVVSTRQDIERLSEITSKLLASVKRHGVPAIGFVNEGKLIVEGKRSDERIALLQMWLDAGLELGNHTYSHRSLNQVPLDEFQQDVIRGEEVTRGLLAKKNKKLRYFRHPFLQTGRELEKKHGFESFLGGRGYTVAPVTIDNSDWLFARAYDNTADRNDKDGHRRVADAYVPYMESVFDFYEKQSVGLFGREIKQILLIHANSMNADYFDEMAQMIKKRGYEFITLDEALKDEAYKSPDTFTGAGGISWLHRWAITRNVPRTFFAGEPEPPDFVTKFAETPAR